MIVLFFCAFYGSHHVLLILGTHDMPLPFLIKRCIVETCLVRMQTDDCTMMALIGSPSDDIKELVYSGSDLVLRVHKTEWLIHISDRSNCWVHSATWATQWSGHSGSRMKSSTERKIVSEKWLNFWPRSQAKLSYDIRIYQRYRVTSSSIKAITQTIKLEIHCTTFMISIWRQNQYMHLHQAECESLG